MAVAQANVNGVKPQPVKPIAGPVTVPQTIAPKRNLRTEAGQTAQTWDVEGKFLLTSHNIVDPGTFVANVGFAGISQANDDPAPFWHGCACIWRAGRRDDLPQ